MASALSREFLEDQVYSPWVPSAHPRPDACLPLCEISTCRDGMDWRLLPVQIALFLSGSRLAISLVRNRQQHPRNYAEVGEAPPPWPASFSASAASD